VEYDRDESAALVSAIYGSLHGWEMVIRLGQALELTDALWELIPVVAAAGGEHDGMPAADAADRSAAGVRLSVDERDHVRELADRFAEGLDEVYDEALADESRLASVPIADAGADPFGFIGSLVDLAQVGEVVQHNFADLSGVSSDQMLYLRSYMQAKLREPRTPALLRALFVTVVGTIEPLVTRLVRLLLFAQAPEDHSSLADAALEEQSRRLCFGPPSTWRSVLVDQLGVAALDDVVDWARLGRLWEDRNVLVHRAGVVDHRHSQRTGSAANTVLEYQAADVQAVVDEVAAVRFALVAATWNSLEVGMGTIAAEAAGAPIFESLRSGRWRQAQGLALVAQAFGDDAESVAAAKVNRWLARQAGLGAVSIHDEVEAWDISGLPRTFEVARLVLLRRDIEAVALIGELLRSGVMKRADLGDWPLFDRLIAEGKLNDMISERPNGDQ
jgi:hypothetical protein